MWGALGIGDFYYELGVQLIQVHHECPLAPVSDIEPELPLARPSPSSLPAPRTPACYFQRITSTSLPPQARAHQHRRRTPPHGYRTDKRVRRAVQAAGYRGRSRCGAAARRRPAGPARGRRAFDPAVMPVAQGRTGSRAATDRLPSHAVAPLTLRAGTAIHRAAPERNHRMR